MLPAFQRGLQRRWVLVPDKEMVQLSEEPDGAASLASLLAGREDKVSVEISGYQTPLPESGHIGQARVAASARSHLGLPRQHSETLKLGQRLPEADLSGKPSVSTAHCPQWTPATATAHHGFSLGS